MARACRAARLEPSSRAASDLLSLLEKRRSTARRAGCHITGVRHDPFECRSGAVSGRMDEKRTSISARHRPRMKDEVKVTSSPRIRCGHQGPLKHGRSAVGASSRASEVANRPRRLRTSFAHRHRGPAEAGRRSSNRSERRGNYDPPCFREVHPRRGSAVSGDASSVRQRSRYYDVILT